MMPLLNEPKGLASLPNEILLEIFLEKVLTETDLFSLALVSRRFSRLVPVSLYDSIGCRIDHDKVTSNTTCELQKTRTMDNLLRNLHAHPDLGTLVRDLTLEFGERTEGEVVMLLKSLPALRSLILSHRNPCSRDRILDLSDVPMLSLRNFHVWTVHLNAEDVVRFMLLPNIRKLRGLLQARPNDPVIELAGLAGKSSLKSLRLNSNEPHVAMRELLAVPEALEHFHQYAGFYTSAQTLSPKTTSCALMPTWSTLQSLILMGYQSWEGQLIETDGSLMDFSGFASLRSLSVIHIYCFLSGDGIQLSERSGFHRRLPSSLEALQVRGRLPLPQIYSKHPCGAADLIF
jgi:hypothetical protein